ncbi:MAG: tRNA 2-thiouridine(34) synthase MnmA, partial [Candidatus Eremiobacteraeota bacterium]|nr:tRNA 2-thiouridine(34) synthase MnmA [Candidatus Eremiobacteraeota bacterium]
RYRARPVAAQAEYDGEVLRLRFREKVRAVTPGQLVAIFALDGAEVLGAATIREAA